jgi:hypothetical protein
VEDRGIIEESQVGHVLAFLELGRIDLANLFGLENFFLKKVRKKSFFVSLFFIFKRVCTHITKISMVNFQIVANS